MLKRSQRRSAGRLLRYMLRLVACSGARHLCGIPQVEGRIVRSNHLPTPAGQLCSAALEYEEQIAARTEATFRTYDHG